MTASHDHQYLLDRAAIHDLHVRYFEGVDTGDKERVRRCFASDVVAHYHGRATVHGVDALIESQPCWPKQASGEWKISTHFMGNLNFKLLDREVAETETHAFAFLVLTTSPPDRVAMRSLRYLDKLVRADGTWLISERLHTLDWSCEVPTTFATPLAARKSARPLRQVSAR
jgi:hypothetical protein